jgi:hypothetical protein
MAMTGDIERIRDALLRADTGASSDAPAELVGVHPRAPDDAAEANRGGR